MILNVKSIISIWMLFGWVASTILFIQIHGSFGSGVQKRWRRGSQIRALENSSDLQRRESPPFNVFPIPELMHIPIPIYENEGRDINTNNNNNSSEVGGIGRGENVEQKKTKNNNNNDDLNGNNNSNSTVNSENSEEYPSLQDFLERLSDVGIGYIVRDLFTAYITEDHEIRTVLGDLGRVGVIALALQTLGQYGNVTGIPEDKSRDLIRLSRYTGVGITLLGSYFDLYLLFDSIACLLRERRVKNLCQSSSGSYDENENEVENDFDMNSKKSKHKFKMASNFDHLSPEDAEFCEDIKKKSELYQESLGLGEFLCRRSHPIIEILAAVIATIADSITFATPQYGQAAAFGETLYQLLAYIYVAGEEGGHFNKVDSNFLFSLGELGELIYRELKSLATERRPPLQGIPDWMPGESSDHLIKH